LANEHYLPEVGEHFCVQKKGKHCVTTPRCEACGMSRMANEMLMRTEPHVVMGHEYPEDWARHTDTPAAAVSDLTATLTERGSRYGKFTSHSEATQALKRVVLHHIRTNTTKFEDDQLEALDMICHKIGRIVNGDPNYADSWVDIAGYAKLVADRLEGTER
jgi:hypothetical protein